MELQLIVISFYFQFLSSHLNGDTETISAFPLNYMKLNIGYQEQKFMNKTNIKEYPANQR